MKTRGQSTLEYVILTGFIVAALIAMGTYMKRGVQGKLRESTDSVGEQYEAGETTGKYTTNISQQQHESVRAKGETETTMDQAQNWQKKSGSETVTAWEVTP